MLFIHRQYTRVNQGARVRPDKPHPRPPPRGAGRRARSPGINRAVVQAINVGRSIDPNVQAVLDLRRPRGGCRRSARAGSASCPTCRWSSSSRRTGRSSRRCISYLDVLDRAWPSDKEAPITFVVIPEYVARSWWERILYNQSAKRLRTALLGRPHTVVVNVPYRRETGDVIEQPDRPTSRRAHAAAGTWTAGPAKRANAVGVMRGVPRQPRSALVVVGGAGARRRAPGSGPRRRHPRLRRPGPRTRRASASASYYASGGTRTTHRCCTCSGRSAWL